MDILSAEQNIVAIFLFSLVVYVGIIGTHIVGKMLSTVIISIPLTHSSLKLITPSNNNYRFHLINHYLFINHY